MLAAVAGIGSQVEPTAALARIVAAAVEVTGARYGALGLIGEGGQLSGFIPVGMTAEEIARIDHWPEGRGLLGEPIRHPGPLRLADLAADPAFAGFPPGHPPMRSFLAAPVLIREEFFGNLYLTDKQGGAEFTAQDEELLVAVAGAAALAVENARLRAADHRHEQWQRATAEVTQQLLAADEPRDVLAVVAQHALEISGADVVTLGLPDAAGDVVVTHAAGYDAGKLVGVRSPAQASLSGLVMGTGRRLEVPDFATDERVAWPVRQLARLGPAVAVPLGVPGDVHGVMIAARQSGSQPMPPAAVQMVATFAIQAGVADQAGRGTAVAERVALSEDRDRIARDLHDLVIQRLFASGMALESSLRLIDSDIASKRVRRVVDELDTTIREIRTAIYTLHTRGHRPHERAQPGARRDRADRGDRVDARPALRGAGRLRRPAGAGAAAGGGAGGGPVQRRSACAGQRGRDPGRGQP